MKRKFFSALLCMAMASTSLLGYGSTVFAESADDSVSSYADIEKREYKDVKLQMLDRFDTTAEDGKWLHNTIDSFMQKYPGIEIETIDITTESDYLDQEAVLMSDESSMPNIFQGNGGSTIASYIKAGNMLDLTGYYDADPEWKNSFNNVGWDATDFSFFGCDGTYGVPYQEFIISLYYNEDLLDRCNIDPQSIKSWDDLMNACATLKENGIQPFEIGEKANWRFGHLHTILNYKTYGTDVAYKLGNDEMTYDSDEQKAVYQMIIDAANEGYLGTNLLGTDDSQESEIFNAGNVAFLFNGSWYCSSVQDPSNTLLQEQKIHALPFPYVNEEFAGEDMGGAGDCFYVTDSGDDDENAAAVLFLKYLMKQENIDKLVEKYSTLTAVDPSQPTDNYLMVEVQDIMKDTTSAKGDIENYDQGQYMLDIVRNALQGLPTGYTADEVAQTIIDTEKEYE